MTRSGVFDAVREAAPTTVRAVLIAAALAAVSVRPVVAETAGALTGVTKFDMQFPSLLRKGVTVNATCNAANGAVQCT